MDGWMQLNMGIYLEISAYLRFLKCGGNKYII